MIESIRRWVMESPAVGWYYRAQSYVDIAWGEFEWWTDSLPSMMAFVYLSEKIGILISGTGIGVMIATAFIGCYFIGRFFKRIGTYDRSVYVEADIDPYSKELLEAARIIIKDRNEEEYLKSKADMWTSMDYRRHFIKKDYNENRKKDTNN